MADLINIKFPDGKFKKIEKGLNGFDIAKQISISLSKAAIAFKVNGKYQIYQEQLKKTQKFKY